MRVAMLACAERRIETVLEWPDLERIIGRPRREDELPIQPRWASLSKPTPWTISRLAVLKSFRQGCPLRMPPGAALVDLRTSLARGNGRMRERARRLSADAKYFTLNSSTLQRRIGSLTYGSSGNLQR